MLGPPGRLRTSGATACSAAKVRPMIGSDPASTARRSAEVTHDPPVRSSAWQPADSADVTGPGTAMTWRLSAVARDANGREIAGLTPQWSFSRSELAVLAHFYRRCADRGFAVYAEF